MKIVINSCYGGYGLSEAAYKELGLDWDGYGFLFAGNRTDPKLIACVEKLVAAASGKCSELTVIEIPDDVEYEIEEYDGREWVAEKHRTWN